MSLIQEARHPLPKNRHYIRKEPALSRRRNFRRKQHGLFLFTQKFLLVSLTAWLFPMALAVPYGRKSSRSVCLWLTPLLSPLSPRRLPESPFSSHIIPSFLPLPLLAFPGNAQNKNIRLRSPFNKCANRRFKQHMDQLCACTDQ